MNLTQVITLVLPILILVIMLGLGLNLAISDFNRVLKEPRSILIALACQSFLLTFIAFLLCKLTMAPPPLAIGMMLLAASPGGPSSNIFSHLAGGDVAFNLSLTAANSLLSILTLPAAVWITTLTFANEAVRLPLPVQTLLETLLIVLLPVAIGMSVKAKYPAIANRLVKPIKTLSVIALFSVVIATVFSERAVLTSSFTQIGGLVVTFNLISLSVGIFLPLWLQVPRAQAISIGFEIGIHNAALAMYIATTHFKELTYALPATAYSVSMYLTSFIAVITIRKFMSPAP